MVKIDESIHQDTDLYNFIVKYVNKVSNTMENTKVVEVQKIGSKLQFIIEVNN